MALSSPDSDGRASRNASPNLRFFLAAAASLTLMFLDNRGTYLEDIRARLGAAMYPLQVAIDSPSAGARWVRENLALRDRLIRDNAALRRQALADRAGLQRLAALEAENARMRALLGSRPRGADRVLVGEILAVDMDPLRHRVVLDKGGRDGVREGQALIDAQGVVGQVTRDQQDSAEAILITDPDHAVPVEIARNGLRTIAMGTGDLERLTLPFLTRNADIRAGDLLVTSGLGGTFPPGYAVGTVTGVDGSSGDAFLEVAAKPAASLDRLHEVLILFDARGSAPEAAVSLAPAPANPAAAPEGEPPAAPPGPPVSTPPAGASPPAATPEATGTVTPATATTPVEAAPAAEASPPPGNAGPPSAPAEAVAPVPAPPPPSMEPPAAVPPVPMPGPEPAPAPAPDTAAQGAPG